MTAERYVLELHLPNRAPRCAGVVLWDAGSDRAVFAMRQDWAKGADPADYEILTHYEEMFRQHIAHLGGRCFVEQLCVQASHVLRLREPEKIEISNAEDLDSEAQIQLALLEIWQ
ncbi:MAG: hypothetical protein IT165_29275 [Bryobacterales bacterium]|nr:hypothetical protein [Bryobacterales bacterium]